MAGWCFVSEREGVVLEQFRRHDGRLAWACADQAACLKAYAETFPTRRPKRRRTTTRGPVEERKK